MFYNEAKELLSSVENKDKISEVIVKELMHTFTLPTLPYQVHFLHHPLIIYIVLPLGQSLKKMDHVG